MFDTDGTVRGEVDFEPLRRPPCERVADVAEALLVWQSLPRATWLDGSETVAWQRLRVFGGLPRRLPLHLNDQLANADPRQRRCAAVALTRIGEPAEALAADCAELFWIPGPAELSRQP